MKSSAVSASEDSSPAATPHKELGVAATLRSAIIALLAGFSLCGQDPTIRVDVQQVVVPVIVSDKTGRHVAGLKESDFRLLEDGVPQKLASFSGGPGASGTYVICIDTLHTSPASAARLRDTLEKLFEGAKLGDAQYVLIGIGRQLRVLQTATANPLAILAKLRSPGFQQNFGGYDEPAFEAQINTLRSRMDEFCKHCACTARQSQAACGGEIEALRQNVDSEAAPWTALANGLLDQFRSVAGELAKIPTARTLIFVSDGFELDPRREFYRVVSGYLPGRPQFQIAGSSDSGLADVLKVAADRNIRIDAIDSRVGTAAPSLSSPAGAMDASTAANSSGTSVLGTLRSNGNPGTRGTYLGSSPVPATQNITEPSRSMEELANLTGGVYSHASDLLKEFRNALGDGRDFYVLTYTPQNTAQNGAFRHISVETADRRLTIRAKSGYWAPVAAQ